MIREVITQSKNVYILNLPDEMVGKTVEVIAFEIDNTNDNGVKTKASQTLHEIKERYSKLPIISHDNYTFNREEANDYE